MNVADWTPIAPRRRKGRRINWDDPTARYNLINQVGPEKYNELLEKHFEDTTIETVNGYPIFMVQGVHMVRYADKGHVTLEGARRIAESLPERQIEGNTPSAPKGP